MKATVMSNNEKPRIEDLAAEAALWHTYREIRKAKGIDIAQLYVESARELEQGLTSPGAREEFRELCNAGCLPQGLALLTLLLRDSGLLEKLWTETVGQPNNREKASRSLENAAQTLESLYADVIALSEDVENERVAKVGRIPPSRLISELRFHIQLINFASKISADTETRSPGQLARYLLTSYVKVMTGDFHDRSVSGLIGEVGSSPDYNEVAHRMWRNRNYERVDKHFSWIVKFLVAMSVVIEQTA